MVMGNGLEDLPGGFDAFSVSGMDGMGPMGPSMDSQLPAPNELPGFDPRGGDQAQPWYLQSSNGSSGSLNSIAMPNQSSGNYNNSTQSESQHGQHDHNAQGDQGKKAPQMIPCPGCSEKVLETSMSCPKCHYSFFVNCPHCHELVDASDAKPGVTEPCPYCNATIERMALALDGTEGAMPYTSEKLSGARGQFPAMQDFAVAVPKRGLSFGWVVDLLWLIVIVMTVWALTQLPTWLHLTGQY
jgi:hypothetical protein